MNYISKINNLVENLEVFENEEFGQVRAINIENEPWFVAKDIVKDLGYEINKTTSYTKYINQYCSQEDIKKVNNSTAELFGMKDAGRKGEILINEYALYDLVLDSPLPSAKKFKKWITHKVLPSIRKHGAYMTDNVLEQAISNPDFMIGLLTNLKEEKEKRRIAEDENIKLSEIIEEQKPKMEYLDEILNCTDAMLVTNIAFDYGLSARALNRILCEERVQRKVRNQYILYSEYMGKG